MANTTKKTAAPAPAEMKETAVKAAETPAAEVKTEAKKEAAKKPAAKKPAAKKTTSKKTETKAAPKKTTKKKGLSYEDVVAATKKKMAAADITKIKYPIPANVELNGSADGIFYIYIADGEIAVEPYKYDDYDVYLRADADEFMNVMTGKKNIYDALAEGLIKIDGNTKKAILLIHAAF